MIKIDQSFIRDLLTDAEDAAITHGVIKLAHALRILVIAEGVDAPEKLETLLQWNCDQYQGYYLNEPMGALALTAWLDEFKTKGLPRSL